MANKILPFKDAGIKTVGTKMSDQDCFCIIGMEFKILNIQNKEIQGVICKATTETGEPCEDKFTTSSVLVAQCKEIADKFGVEVQPNVFEIAPPILVVVKEVASNSRPRATYLTFE